MLTQLCSQGCGVADAWLARYICFKTPHSLLTFLKRAVEQQCILKKLIFCDFCLEAQTLAPLEVAV